MQRDSKLGYGYLLVGAALAYLIDKALGLTTAIIVSVICLVVGGAFLWAGHRHKEGEAQPRKRIREWLLTVSILSVLVVVISTTILKYMPKKEFEKSERATQSPSKREESNKEPPKTESPRIPEKKSPAKLQSKKPSPPTVLEHPVIGVAASSVIKDASSRQVKITVRLQNASSFETTAHVGVTATWNGAVIYPITEPRDYAFTALAWVEVTHPVYLSQQDEAAFLDGTGSLRIYLNAEYPDRGGKTILVLEGRVDPKLDTIDVTKSAWSH